MSVSIPDKILCQGGARCQVEEKWTEAMTLQEKAADLTNCAAFGWDVLMGGEFTGCAFRLIRTLSKDSGGRAVLEAFNMVKED